MTITMRIGLVCGLLLIATTLGASSKTSSSSGSSRSSEKRGGSCSKGKPKYSFTENICGTFREDDDTYKALKVKYASDDIDHCGDRKTVAQANEKPWVQFDDADENKHYTLLMVDPDAPFVEDPTSRYWLHWLVTNIHGEDLISESSDLGGKTLTDYAPPSPPRGQEHRYQFFLFEHDEEPSDPGKERACFCVVGFVERNNLGDPVAATEFITETPEMNEITS